MNILIIKLGAIGDVLRTTGVLRGLHKKYNAPNIYWMTAPISIPLLARNPLISHVLTMDQWNTFKGTQFDLVISLDDEEEACRIATEAGATRIIGAYMSEHGRTYTPSAWFDMSLLGGPDRDDLKKANKQTFQHHMATMLEIDEHEMEPILILGEKERALQQQFKTDNNIGESETLIAINTGASGRWQYKKLGEEKTARLINALHGTTGCRCILLGGPEEYERNAKIASMVNVPFIQARNDHSLLEFAAIIDLCSTLVTSDSLALHIGTALRKKVVAFFGPTSLAEIELFGRGKKLAPDMNCLVCYKRTCDFNPACMQLLSVDKLVSAVKEVGA